MCTGGLRSPLAKWKTPRILLAKSVPVEVSLHCDKLTPSGVSKPHVSTSVCSEFDS